MEDPAGDPTSGARRPQIGHRQGSCRCRGRSRQGFRYEEDRRAREEAISDPLILRLTNTAEGDLAEIWAYIAAEASESIATRFLEAVEAKFNPLLYSPLIGSRRDQFGPGLRVIFHTPYAIYYLPANRELVIVRVLHGARDAAAIADQGGFKQ